VVGDDGSTDGTLEILERFAKRAPFPVRIQQNPANLGYGENFLSTASRCSGEWIAFCDQDDVWLPDKLAFATRILSRFPDVKLFVHELTACDEELCPFAHRTNGNLRSRRYGPRQGPLRTAAGCSMVFSRDLIRCADWRSWPRSRGDEKGVAHDWWIGIVAFAVAPRYLCRASLVRHRRHRQAITSSFANGFRARFGRISSTSGGSLRAAGDAMNAAAKWLQGEAQKHGPSMRTAFVEAAEVMRDRARVYEMRAALYDAKGHFQRLPMLFRLVANAEYRRSFTFHDHAKDLLRAALPLGS
jgi:glycosyltransferase involved in cell wall biosynthesis